VLWPAESNADVGDSDRAAQKAPEGITDRQTGTHTIRPLYDDYGTMKIGLLYLCSLVFEGALKTREWKMREWKTRHQVARGENAGVENVAPSS